MPEHAPQSSADLSTLEAYLSTLEAARPEHAAQSSAYVRLTGLTPAWVERSRWAGGGPPAYVSTPEAARLTGLSLAWFERSRWAGGGPPFVKVGRTVRYPLDELHSFMRRRLCRSTTDVPVATERPA